MAIIELGFKHFKCISISLFAILVTAAISDAIGIGIVLTLDV